MSEYLRLRGGDQERERKVKGFKEAPEEQVKMETGSR